MLLLAALQLSLHGSPGIGATTGSVSGRVVDVEHRPVAGIDLHIGPAEGIHFRRPVIATTDEDGCFVFTVEPGRYGLNAYDESRGYLNSYFAVNGFGQQNAYVIVDVGAGETVEDVLIETTPIAGHLEIIVVDDGTGEPIIGAGVDVAVYEAPKIFKGHSASHVDGIPVERLIPSEIDLKLTVFASGYQTVDLEQNGSPRIRFAQGERRSIVVRLRRQS